MYTPLESPNHQATESRQKTCKQWFQMSLLRNSWFTSSFKPNVNHRRTFTCFAPCLRRLPILILWTIIVIVILHQLTTTHTGIPLDDGTRPESMPKLAIDINSHELPPSGHHSLRAIHRLTSDGAQHQANQHQQYHDEPQRATYQQMTEESSDNHETAVLIPTQQQSLPVSTTRKSPTSEHARLGKVFILIIQSEPTHNSNLRHGLLRRNNLDNSASSPSAKTLTAQPFDQYRRLRIPPHIKTLIEILESHRISFEIDTTRSGLPSQLLSDHDGKNYSVVVIDNFVRYTKLNRWIRDQLDRYCRTNGIGVITYLKPEDDYNYLNDGHILYQSSRNHILNRRSISSTTTVETLTDQFPLIVKPIKPDCRNHSSTNCFTDFQINEQTPLLRILKRKPNFILKGQLDVSLSPWVTISSNHITYEPISWAKSATDDRNVFSMYDQGLYDGIKRVIFGFANHHWLNRILLLDSIEHLSGGRIISPLIRYIQIDIDDIFVGEKGIRMNIDDVRHLIQTQAELSKLIDGGFKFNLGFSGKYFKHGYPEENLGDEFLITHANEFTWFCHFWSHAKAHLFNDTQGIATELKRNLQFAREKQLPIIGWGNALNQNESVNPPTYAVAPHHSGVYPIHEQLYQAWRDILNVQVTTTEEYPHLKPSIARRAFVHHSITVLPRQTCGLYTHTIFKQKYPGGFGKLVASINGGELFETVLHNPVNIYMTHMSNYANDRLAPSTFTELLRFVQANTNLQLRYAASGENYMNHVDDGNGGDNGGLVNENLSTDKSVTNEIQIGRLGPAYLARYYLSLYPHERAPVWTNPCDDPRHLAIWSSSKHRYCSFSPSLLIVGPQKTGTTALYTFLKINPLLKSSQISRDDYEEVQFFNDKHYFQGVEWYFKKFYNNIDAVMKTVSDHSNISINDYYIFDKSATYFDDPKVPHRASTLLPNAHVLIILINPADRAYSWYQHMRAHQDPIAQLLSFEQLIRLYMDNFFSETHDSSNGLHPEIYNLNSSQILQARSLLNRCLQPGYYAKHLLNWLDHYPSRQIIIVDGQWFKFNPAAVLNRLQLLLRLPHQIDYNKHLVYDEKKGYYCQRLESGSTDNGTYSRNNLRHHSKPDLVSQVKCLGTSKGRQYPAMSQVARNFLDRHYRDHNRQLARLLSDIGQPLPNWLDESINNLIPPALNSIKLDCDLRRVENILSKTEQIWY